MGEGLSGKMNPLTHRAQDSYSWLGSSPERSKRPGLFFVRSILQPVPVAVNQDRCRKALTRV